jgi:glycerol-3-phosphate acyltransferase PlsX
MIKGALTTLIQRMDYTEYGGAPLLGVNGGCVICHGRSNAKAIKSAIRVARNFIENEIGTKIRDKIGELHTLETELV